MINKSTIYTVIFKKYRTALYETGRKNHYKCNFWAGGALKLVCGNMKNYVPGIKEVPAVTQLHIVPLWLRQRGKKKLRFNYGITVLVSKKIS